MTNLQLALSIGIPSLLVLVGIFLNNSRFSSIDNRFTAMDARMDSRFNAVDACLDRMGSELNARIDRMGSELSARLDRQQSDLSQFYETLGRHDAEIINLKDRQRSA